MMYTLVIENRAVSMQYKTLLFEHRERLARVTLNRPDKLNALNAQSIEDLTAVAAVIESDADVRVHIVPRRRTGAVDIAAAGV